MHWQAVLVWIVCGCLDDYMITNKEACISQAKRCGKQACGLLASLGLLCLRCNPARRAAYSKYLSSSGCMNLSLSSCIAFVDSWLGLGHHGRRRHHCCRRRRHRRRRTNQQAKIQPISKCASSQPPQLIPSNTLLPHLMPLNPMSHVHACRNPSTGSNLMIRLSDACTSCKCTANRARSDMQEARVPFEEIIKRYSKDPAERGQRCYKQRAGGRQRAPLYNLGPSARSSCRRAFSMMMCHVSRSRGLGRTSSGRATAIRSMQLARPKPRSLPWLHRARAPGRVLPRPSLRRQVAGFRSSGVCFDRPLAFCNIHLAKGCLGGVVTHLKP